MMFFEPITKQGILEQLSKPVIIGKDGERLDRGFYICLEGGYLYLDENGALTQGVKFFWKAEDEAKEFLKEWEAKE